MVLGKITMVCHMVCGKWHMVCGHCQKCRESYVKSFQTMGDRNHNLEYLKLLVWRLLLNKITMVCRMVCGKWHMVCGHCQKCREPYVKSFQTMGDRNHNVAYLKLLVWRLFLKNHNGLSHGFWEMTYGLWALPKVPRTICQILPNHGNEVDVSKDWKGLFFSMEVPKTKWNKESVIETGLWKPEAAVPWLWNWCTVPCWSRYIWYILYISCIWGLLDGSESESWDIRKTCLIANVMWPVEEGGVRAAFNSQTWRRWQEGPGT